MNKSKATVNRAYTTYHRLRLRRRLRRARANKYRSNQIYRMTQSQRMNPSNINVSTGAATYANPTSTVTYFGSTAANVLNDSSFAMFFTLNDVVQASSFQSIYDRYRITKVQVTIGRTQNTANQANSTQNTTYPSQQLWSVIDYDDAAVLATLTDLQQYAGAKCHNVLDKDIVITFKPRIAQSAYGSGVFTSFANTSSNTWIDIASPAVQYYGLKLVIPCPINTTFAEQNFTIRTKFWIDFKNIR